MRLTDDELDAIREKNPCSKVLMERLGVRLKKNGREWIGHSPFNSEKSPSFTVNDEKGFAHCFSSGFHGDVIDCVMHITGKSFVEAVEFLGGAQEVSPEERARLERVRRENAAREERERREAMSVSERVYTEAAPIEGTPAEAYLFKRGLMPGPSWTFDIRFKELSYKGYADPAAKETTDLGRFPAMVSAIRDVNGCIIGLHRTFIDPKSYGKLVIGDARRNKAKKVYGNVTGGMIRLSPPSELLAIGEGIETSRAWQLLGYRDDYAIAAAVSLGNMAGGATGTLPHPEEEGKRIQNGEPDLDRPGVVLPGEVLEVILLGDGDSSLINTSAQLLVAGRRFRKEGRAVGVHWADRDMDFADMLVAKCDAGKAASEA